MAQTRTNAPCLVRVALAIQYRATRRSHREGAKDGQHPDRTQEPSAGHGRARELRGALRRSAHPCRGTAPRQEPISVGGPVHAGPNERRTVVRGQLRGRRGRPRPHRRPGRRHPQPQLRRGGCGPGRIGLGELLADRWERAPQAPRRRGTSLGLLGRTRHAGIHRLLRAARDRPAAFGRDGVRLWSRRRRR